jgi:hypothetical protein
MTVNIVSYGPGKTHIETVDDSLLLSLPDRDQCRQAIIISLTSARWALHAIILYHDPADAIYSSLHEQPRRV